MQPTRTICQGIQQHKLVASILITGILISQSTKLTAETINESPSNTVVNVEDAIDGAYKEASELLNNFASQLDNYFAEETNLNQVNNTSATVVLDFADPSEDDFSLKGKLKLRLVLPRSQRKIRLLLDVDDDNNTKSPSTQPLTTADEDRALSLALRFIRKAREGASLNIDVGARRHEKKIQGFARVRASFEKKTLRGWSYKFNNDFRQYHSSGYWDQLSLDFWQKTRQGSKTVVRSSSNIKWENHHPGAQIDQTVGIYKEFKQGSLLAIELLAGYKTAPANDASYYDGHQIRLRYRRNAFRPWFHFEVWPSLKWQSNQDSNPKFGGLIRTEVRFGHK